MAELLQKRPFGLKGGEYGLSIRNTFVILLIISCITSIIGCTVIATFDQKAYDQDIAIQTMSLQLMDNAVEDFNSHQDQVKTLRAEIDAAIAYEKNRPNNGVSVKMWTVLMDPARNLMGGFLKLWQSQGKLSKAYVDGEKKTISAAFDQIIQLEEDKKQNPVPTKTK